MGRLNACVQFHPLDRYDEDGDDEDDNYEGGVEEDDGGEEEAEQGEHVCGWQEEGRGHEEEGPWHFRPEDAEPGLGGHLRCEVAAAYGSHEENLGLHQEEPA